MLVTSDSFALLQSLLTNSPVKTVSALRTSVLRIVTQANEDRESGVEDWSVGPRLSAWSIDVSLLSGGVPLKALSLSSVPSLRPSRTFQTMSMMPADRDRLTLKISLRMSFHPSSRFQVRGVVSSVRSEISDCQDIAYPFLQGRCLFLASRFAELLPADVRRQYFEAAIQVLESNETEIPFKVSAVKSIQQFVVWSLQIFCAHLLFT